MTDAFLFAVNAVFPIVLVIIIGYILKRIRLFGKEFLNEGNRFVFKVLLPALLFYNVYGIESLKDVNIPFVAYGILTVLAIFFLAIAVTCAFTKDSAKRGSLIQAIFRSNYAIIGLPLAESLFGAKGAAAASVMSAFCIPTFNVLAVITLTVFNSNNEKGRIDVKKIIRGIVTNPLILATVTGIVVLGIRECFIAYDISFRLKDIKFLYKTLEYLKTMCTPLALIVLGGRFEFSAVRKLWKEILYGTVIRTCVVPIIGLTGAFLLKMYVFKDFDGAHFASYVGVFATPVAVSSAVMAKEMGGDDELSGQLVVWTSLVSTFTIFIYVMVLRALGIF